MRLSHPDARRALRSVLQVVVIIALLALVWWLSERRLSRNPAYLIEIVRYALGIIGVSTLFYGAENVTRAVKASFGPASFEIGRDEEPPA